VHYLARYLNSTCKLRISAELVRVQAFWDMRLDDVLINPPKDGDTTFF